MFPQRLSQRTTDVALDHLLMQSRCQLERVGASCMRHLSWHDAFSDSLHRLVSDVRLLVELATNSAAGTIPTSAACAAATSPRNTVSDREGSAMPNPNTNATESANACRDHLEPTGLQAMAQHVASMSMEELLIGLESAVANFLMSRLRDELRLLSSLMTNNDDVPAALDAWAQQPACREFLLLHELLVHICARHEVVGAGVLAATFAALETAQQLPHLGSPRWVAQLLAQLGQVARENGASGGALPPFARDAFAAVIGSLKWVASHGSSHTQVV